MSTCSFPSLMNDEPCVYQCFCCTPAAFIFTKSTFPPRRRFSVYKSCDWRLLKFHGNSESLSMYSNAWLQDTPCLNPAAGGACADSHPNRVLAAVVMQAATLWTFLFCRRGIFPIYFQVHICIQILWRDSNIVVGKGWNMPSCAQAHILYFFHYYTTDWETRTT